MPKYVVSHQVGIAGCTEREVERVEIEAANEQDAIEDASGGWFEGRNPDVTQGGPGRYNDYWMIEPGEEHLDVLAELADVYGEDAAFDYVHDCWGNEPCTLTPAEAIALHQDQHWADNTYSVRRAAKPGQPVLVDSIGNAILVMPDAKAR